MRTAGDGGIVTYLFTAQRTANASSLNFGRIAKPLRGGGGNVGGGAPGTTSSSGGYSSSSANPLARLQGEDSGGGSGMYAVYSDIYCAPQAGVSIETLIECSQPLRNVHHGSSRRRERREARRRFNFGLWSEWLGGKMAERKGEEGGGGHWKCNVLR